MTRRLLPLLGVLLALLLPLTACGGGDDSDSPAGSSSDEVLATAKQKFDDARSVHLSLATKSKPSDGNGVLSADGTLTHDPAFKGEVEVVLSGLQAKVPVVAVDGTLYAKLPLTSSYASIDPEEYGAPDPATFADPDIGISTLLTQLDNVKELGQERQGKLVLQSYSGTLPGEKVAPIIPSAATNSSYDTELGIDQDGYLRTLKVTGAFFSGSDDVTYTMTFDDYDKSVEITKP